MVRRRRHKPAAIDYRSILSIYIYIYFYSAARRWRWRVFLWQPRHRPRGPISFFDSCTQNATSIYLYCVGSLLVPFYFQVEIVFVFFVLTRECLPCCSYGRALSVFSTRPPLFVLLSSPTMWGRNLLEKTNFGSHRPLAFIYRAFIFADYFFFFYRLV